MKPLVVIPTKNRPISLQRCVGSLLKTNYDGDIKIFVDKTGDVDTDKCPISSTNRITIDTHHKRGWGATLNLAVHFAITHGYDRVIWINDDTIFVRPDWYDRVDYLLGSNGAKLITFSKPNRYSAIAFDVDLFVHIGPMDEAYIEGGYDDKDLSLRMGYLCKERPARPYREGLIVAEDIVMHNAFGEGGGWNHTVNMIAHNAKWIEVPSDHPYAKEEKESGCYYALVSEVALIKERENGWKR